MKPSLRECDTRPWEFSQGESIGDIFKGGKCNAIPLNSHTPQQIPEMYK